MTGWRHRTNQRISSGGSVAVLGRAAFGFALWLVLLIPTASVAAGEPVDIGSRLELFVDRHLIDSMRGVELRLHEPRRAEVVLRFDEPWEGPTSAYATVLEDGDRFRMYYRGSSQDSGEVSCYAESHDGISWTKPRLGLFEWSGSTENNIVWMGAGNHNFTPFLDERPGVPADERYKAVARTSRGEGRGLLPFASADGIRWRLLSDKPVITKGAFDSQNLAFWDPNRGCYVSYYRVTADTSTGRRRHIAMAESKDFLKWSEPLNLDTGDLGDHFYTNATAPYFRAPHLYFAFPKRFVADRQLLPEHPARGISEGIFMSSRDGVHFDRTFPQALIRPGRDEGNWGDRSNMPVWGLVQTAEDEMSLYFSQNYRLPTAHLRRGVFRLDGISSAHAGWEPGELVTKPIRFGGSMLVLNFATSASGSVRVEIQDASGQPLSGFALADSRELYGDAIAQAYAWKGGADVSALVGQAVRLRFVLQDADLYSFQFTP